jgi:hypothetical protein
MATYTLVYRENRFWSWILYVGLVLVVVGGLLAFTGGHQTAPTAAQHVNGVWEQTYLIEGANAPALQSTGVNRSIEWAAAINARVAGTVRPGEDVNGNSERLMFGLE